VRRLLTVEVKRVFDDEKRRPGVPRIARRLQDGKASRPIGTAYPRSCGTTAGGRKQPGNTRRPRTASIHCLLPPTYWRRISAQTSLTQNGCGHHLNIWTDEGWLYLAVVLELYSRRVIGWTIAERMTATLVCDALIMALASKGAKRDHCPFMVNGFKPVSMPSIRCSNTLKCITIAKGFTQN
jgi:putative transposase